MNLTAFLPCGFRAASAALTLAVFAGCASDPDYAYLDRYYESLPKTVIVLPAQNQTTDAEAPTLFMSTINSPLIERGYYVIPSHMTAAVLEREGIDLGGESWEIAPTRLHEFLGADAILYIIITEWDTTYAVIKTVVRVGFVYRLVDARTGAVLWEQTGRKVVQSGGHLGGGGPIGLLAGLVVTAANAAVTAASSRYITMAAEVNKQVAGKLPVGGYHADYDSVREEVARWKEKQQTLGKARTDAKPGVDDEGEQ